MKNVETYDVDKIVNSKKKKSHLDTDESVTVGDLKGLIQGSTKKEIRVLKDIFHAHMDEQVEKLKCKCCGKITKLDGHVVLIQSSETQDKEDYFCSMNHLKKWLKEQE